MVIGVEGLAVVAQVLADVTLWKVCTVVLHVRTTVKTWRFRSRARTLPVLDTRVVDTGSSILANAAVVLLGPEQAVQENYRMSGRLVLFGAKDLVGELVVERAGC